MFRAHESSEKMQTWLCWGPDRWSGHSELRDLAHEVNEAVMLLVSMEELPPVVADAAGTGAGHQPRGSLPAVWEHLTPIQHPCVLQQLPHSGDPTGLGKAQRPDKVRAAEVLGQTCTSAEPIGLPPLTIPSPMATHLRRPGAGSLGSSDPGRPFDAGSGRGSELHPWQLPSRGRHRCLQTGAFASRRQISIARVFCLERTRDSSL